MSVIYQIPINLDIHNKRVQAIIDLETGCIGFTESINNKTIEYNFLEGPIEFKKALITKLEPLYAKSSLANFKIYRTDKKNAKDN